MNMIFKELGTVVAIKRHSFDALSPFFKEDPSRYQRCCIVTDERVGPLYADKVMDLLKLSGLSATLLQLPINEKSKDLATAEQCWVAIRKQNLDRHSLIVGLGGGVVTDLAGFVAACYMRGIDCIHLPTTLLGMVDAALGGKTGINLGPHKNNIGAFHQPKLVLINLDCLKTLSKRDFRAGLAEVIKYGVILDSELFDYLENHLEEILSLKPEPLAWIIERCIRIKMGIASEDTREHGKRALLNFGHTYGHALEGLADFELCHGEAVAIGMNCAAKLALRMKMADATLPIRLRAICDRAGLPAELPMQIDYDQLIDLMHSDKKAISGAISLILPIHIGIGVQACVDDRDIKASLNQEVCCG